MSWGKVNIGMGRPVALVVQAVITVGLGAEAASAETLQPGPDASAWLHLGAGCRGWSRV